MSAQEIETADGAGLLYLPITKLFQPTQSTLEFATSMVAGRPGWYLSIILSSTSKLIVSAYLIRVHLLKQISILIKLVSRDWFNG
jgi:hypothetical protein